MLWSIPIEHPINYVCITTKKVHNVH